MLTIPAVNTTTTSSAERIQSKQVKKKTKGSVSKALLVPNGIDKDSQMQFIRVMAFLLVLQDTTAALTRSSTQAPDRGNNDESTPERGHPYAAAIGLGIAVGLLLIGLLTYCCKRMPERRELAQPAHNNDDIGRAAAI